MYVEQSRNLPTQLRRKHEYDFDPLDFDAVLDQTLSFALCESRITSRSRQTST